MFSMTEPTIRNASINAIVLQSRYGRAAIDISEISIVMFIRECPIRPMICGAIRDTINYAAGELVSQVDRR